MKLRRFPTSSGDLYYGPHPNVKTLKALKSMGIDAIWNLASELKLMVPYEKLYAKEVLFGNINDFGVPDDSSFTSQLDRVVSLLKRGKKVFIHCFGGIGRTSTALAAIKVSLEGTDAKEALDLAGKYAHGPETYEQDEYVEKLDHLYNGRPIPKKKKRVQPMLGYKAEDYEKMWQQMLLRRDQERLKDLKDEMARSPAHKEPSIGDMIDRYRIDPATVPLAVPVDKEDRETPIPLIRKKKKKPGEK